MHLYHSHYLQTLSQQSSDPCLRLVTRYISPSVTSLILPRCFFCPLVMFYISKLCLFLALSNLTSYTGSQEACLSVLYVSCSETRLVWVLWCGSIDLFNSFLFIFVFSNFLTKSTCATKRLGERVLQWYIKLSVELGFLSAWLIMYVTLWFRVHLAILQAAVILEIEL